MCDWQAQHRDQIYNEMHIGSDDSDGDDDGLCLGGRVNRLGAMLVLTLRGVMLEVLTLRGGLVPGYV